jgi:hypothetical protein
LRDDCRSGPAGAARLAWSCEFSRDHEHADRIFGKLVSTSAACQSGLMPPAAAFKALHCATKFQPEPISFDDEKHQVAELGEPVDWSHGEHLDPETAIGELVTSAVADLHLSRPAISTIIDAMPFVAAVLASRQETLADLAFHAATPIRAVQLGTRAMVLPAARRLIVGSAARTRPGCTAVYKVTVGPVNRRAAGLDGEVDRRTRLMWARWVRELEAEFAPAVLDIAA